MHNITQSSSLFLSLSVLTAILQVTWVSRCLLKQRIMEVVVTAGAIAAVQSSSQIITQFFYRPDALPVAQPTDSKH